VHTPPSTMTRSAFFDDNAAGRIFRTGSCGRRTGSRDWRWCRWRGWVDCWRSRARRWRSPACPDIRPCSRRRTAGPVRRWRTVASRRRRCRWRWPESGPLSVLSSASASRVRPPTPPAETSVRCSSSSFSASATWRGVRSTRFRFRPVPRLSRKERSTVPAWRRRNTSRESDRSLSTTAPDVWRTDSPRWSFPPLVGSSPAARSSSPSVLPRRDRFPPVRRRCSSSLRPAWRSKRLPGSEEWVACPLRRPSSSRCTLSAGSLSSSRRWRRDHDHHHHHDRAGNAAFGSGFGRRGRLEHRWSSLPATAGRTRRPSNPFFSIRRPAFYVRLNRVDRKSGPICGRLASSVK